MANNTMNHFEFREIGDDEDYDPSSLCENTPFTQAKFYGDWQKSSGRLVKRFLAYRDKEAVAYFQLVKYPLLFGKSYFYIPYGPITSDFSDDFFTSLKQELIRIAKNERAVFIRLDFTPVISNEVLSRLFTKSSSYTYVSSFFQPRSEWFLRLDKPEIELLLGMNSKTRYSIRTAEIREVQVEIISEDFQKYFEIFYELINETATAKGFRLHEKKYYENIFQGLTHKNAFLSVARYGEKILTVDLIIVLGGVANYVFSGSSKEERNRLSSYLSQWKAICHSKELNCAYYNFGGIATKDDLHKSWGGLTSFKKKFGGEEIKHSDFFDVVVRPFWYHLYGLRKRIKKIGT